MNALSSSSSSVAALTRPAAAEAPRTSAPVSVPSLRWGRLSAQATSVAACVLLWHLAVRLHLNLGFVTFANVPDPAEVLGAAWDLLHSPKLLGHLGSSLLRVGLGFGVAAVLGVGLGLMVGRWRWARNFVLPPLEMLRPIPAVAWIPLSILMFPSSEGSMVFITFVGALFPILLNTIHGVESVDVRLIASARSLGTRGWSMFTEVIAPGAAPSIITGLSIGMGTCWFCLVTAEMIAGQFGIGYYTWESYTVQKYASIVVGMLLIGALGMGSSALIRWAGTRLMPWYRPQGAVQ